MRFSFKKTKVSAVFQIVLGSLCFIFGIVDRVLLNRWLRWHVSFYPYIEGVFAIWMGIWFLITGVIGYFASKPYKNTQRPKMAMINTYLGFSIVATVFAGVLLICYSVALHEINNHNFKRSVGLGAMIIIIAIVEFGIGIWASVLCCLTCTNDCWDGCCSDTSSIQDQEQVVYHQTQGGSTTAYVMNQVPNGARVAFPAMTGGPVYPVPNQAVGRQVYMMQNPQGITGVTPTQYVQAAGVQSPNGMPVAFPVTTGEPVHPVPNQVMGRQVYMMQNPQGITGVTPTQYVQAACVQGPNGMPVAFPAMTGGPVNPLTNLPMSDKVYVMQNPQAAIPTQYIQGTSGQINGVPVYPVANQAIDGQVYFMQNPQGATVVTPTQQVQAEGGQVHVQNPQDAITSIPTQQVQEEGEQVCVQNLQGTTAVKPIQQVQEEDEQVHVQNAQGSTAVTSLQQSVINSGYQQPEVNTTDASSEPPPVYTA